jgi:LysW-gamma-L-lysine carboxypeptidase
VLRILDETIKKIEGEKEGVKATYRIEDMTDPFETNPSSALIRSLSLSILDVRKKRPNLLRKTGTGDMNILGNAFKIPVVTYGPGDSHASHSVKERVNIDEYISSIDVFSRALFHISRLHSINGVRVNGTKEKI